MKIRTALTLSLLILSGSETLAKNVDLVTLPRRDTVQLTIYNSEDITLAKETRYVALKKGANRLQFSWAGTLIDPTSVEFRPLQHSDQIEVADTVYPGQKPQHLIWNIDSQIEGQVPVEVSYFTSGLTWQMDYVAVADPQETNLDFHGYVRVYNQSGEDYENAEIRLIVGNINLVEKIAELARRAGIPVPKEEAAAFGQLKSRAMRRSMSRADDAAEGGVSGVAKKIVKEGLSEYFMFSVEGTETIRNGWSKRMIAVDAADVKFDIVYRLRSYQYGPRPVRFFNWRNDQEHELGDSPLPNGLMRVFRNNGREGLSYLGQQSLNYVPIKAEIEVNLGPDDLVVYQRRRVDTARLNFDFHRRNEHVIGWDERQQWVDTVRNYRSKPIAFEMRLKFDGDVDFEAQEKTTSFDYRTVQSELDVRPRDKTEYAYSVTIHHGTNAKQNRVKVTEPT